MPDIQWPQIVASLIGGGAAGAIITAFVTRHRNRIQPIRYKLEIKELFAGVTAGPSTSVQVVLNDKGVVHAFGNLQQVNLEINNRGNVDREKFNFSLSFPHDTKIVLLEANDADRNHKFTSRPEISPAKPVDVLDFEIQPFNRGDVYEVTAYVADAEALKEDDILLTSPAPVSFVASYSSSDLLLKAGLNPVVELSLAGTRLTFK
jgi:hypothetical protein